MRKKRKAVANTMAQDMYAEQSCDAVGDSVSTSNAALDESDGRSINMPATQQPLDFSVVAGYSSGSSQSDMLLPSSFRSSEPLLYGPSGVSFEPSMLAAQSGTSDTQPQDDASTHVNNVVQLPAHAITVDGLASSFTLSEIMGRSLQSGGDVIFDEGLVILCICWCYLSFFFP